MLRINQDTVFEYLVDMGVLPSSSGATARSLGGGISNEVIMVRWDKECMVVKQPLEKLNVEMDWPADLQRIHIEADALKTYRRLLNNAGLERASSPQVLHEDIENHVIVMECIPSGSKMWKAELMEGRVDQTIAKRVGMMLGTVQSRASKDPDVRSKFAFKEHFDELRIDPYLRTAARRNPDVADMVMREAERVFSDGITLVHGDYSPKSVMVDRNPSTPKLWIFDMEVAHWGDPSFDTGFMLNHLLMKAVHLREHREELLEAAQGFWDSYSRSVEWDIETTTVRELGCLMLARADGKSPADYLSPEERRRIELISKRSLTEGVNTIDEYIQLLREEW